MKNDYLVKPILVVRYQTMHLRSVMNECRREARKLLNDEYHVLVLHDDSIKASIHFEVLSPNNADELTEEKVKELIELIEKQNKQ